MFCGNYSDFLTGKGCVNYLESVCTADLKNLTENAAILTVFTNEKGGILDDLIITKITDEHFFIVSNAARKDHDQKHLLKALENHNKRNTSGDIKVQFYTPNERALIAFQGPEAKNVLASLTDANLPQLYFMNSTVASVAGVKDCRITRCGYTGEDGFEISIPAQQAVTVTQEILRNKAAKLAGLGPRDSLRLEAGLCLYGHDITTETSPVEGALTWLISKRRRELADFPGADVILRQIKEGSARKRVGIISDGGPPAREGSKILSETGEELGSITSGCPAPSLGKNIAMGYVPTAFSKVGTKIQLKIREKCFGAVVSKMPFVKANYYNKPKQ